jgi:hypothetical protein
MAQRWRPRTIDVVALVSFSLLWLAPMAFVGARGSTPVAWPPQARDMYAVSCLFGQARERVSMFYVQVRYDDRPGWHDLDEREYFGLEAFGHRTRFDRFMARFGYQDEAVGARTELARWLAATHAARHPDQPRIVAVRYVWADRVIDPDDPPQGCWQKPPRAEAGPARRLGDPVFIEGGS